MALTLKASSRILSMVGFRPSERDPLNWPTPKEPPSTTSRRVGIHTSIAGGVENAAKRAYRLGCNAFQIFSTSPRQWQPYRIGRGLCENMSRFMHKFDL